MADPQFKPGESLVTDGKPISIPDVPYCIDCYDCGDYGIVLYDPKRKKHVTMPRDYTAEGLKAGLCNLGYEPR